MGQTYIEKLNRLVEASEGLRTAPYEIIYYHGIPLIISKRLVKNAIALSWERTGCDEVIPLAEELKLELRRLKNNGERKD